MRYTAPYGSRSIWRDGKPFISIQRDPAWDTPAEVDCAAHAILRLLNADPYMCEDWDTTYHEYLHS